MSENRQPIVDIEQAERDVSIQDVVTFLTEAYAVGKEMLEHGGSFVRMLGQMLSHADYENSKKIKTTWPEYWKQYAEMAKPVVPRQKDEMK
jgi:hypothetical protein